jgi:protein O-GlcNAc transferase
MATIADVLARAVQCYAAGNLAATEQLCRQILQANPAHSDALNLLGLAAQRAGQYQAALEYIGQALAIRPDSAEYHSNLAFVYRSLGRAEEAIASYKKALRLGPNVAELHCSLGAVLGEQGRLAEARTSFQEALRLRPSFPEAHYLMANVLQQMGQLPQAERSFRETARLRPDFPRIHILLGNLQMQMGRPREAEASYRAGLRLQPGNADLLSNLGSALTEQERFAEAEACYQEALRLAPESVETHYNFGLNYAAQGEHDKAFGCYENAVRIKKDFADGLYRLGVACNDRGMLEQAAEYYRRALALRPNDQAIQSSRLLLSHYFADYDPEASFAEHRAWASRLEQTPVQHQPSHPVDRDPGRRLRIGYVSPDFCAHVMGRYSEAVIGAHDRSQFEVFCYANVRKEDECTQHIKAVADHWRSVVGLPDSQVFQMIRDDRINVLIDLAGHTGGNRLRVFALKPAPVQVTHCGYPGGTGLTAIDYRLTDPYCDRPGKTERFHIEKVMYLPEAHWCYAPPPTPEVGPLPAQKAGAVTFASLNNLAKVTEPMIGLWARILGALPQSQLLAQTGAGRAGDERVRAAFARFGTKPDRVTLVPKVKSDAYYRRFGEVDICLDTYPYTGCNTTADALWMGVPVVTRAGPTCVTRLGVSAMVLAGLEDLVTDTPEAYVETAVKLAQDLPRLRALRGELRERVRRTLGDVPRFTRQLETAYRAMWQTFCDREQ